MIYEIENFLSDDECDWLINLINEQVELQKEQFSVYHQIVCHPLPNIAEFLEKRLREKQSDVLYNDFIRINKNMNLTYYTSGQSKQVHRDMIFRDEDSVSVYTLLIYLNDDYENGRTIFYPEAKSLKRDALDKIPNIKIVPKKGKIAIFDINLVHEGEKVKGEKWLWICKLQFTRPKKLRKS
uniref:2OG-Fe(II) oxygenase superfamily protein n=1 Tax=Marseillevirus LCMAC102 TaxID=2506603 RepID=A0A481YU07_9VIRU|nr:MAG: 2OG-Fe(II) oxygenase superfamily protein [Marseillevirus LCMAC102]